jgi:pimeloyl-ACP methyl ester carboxylesterase
MDHHITWEEIALSLFAKGITVISYDQRGHGRSSHVASSSQYHFPDYISDLYRLLEVLNISKCHLVGHSMGGTIASIFSSVFPNIVQKLFLIEGLGPSHENEEQSFQRLCRHFYQRNRLVEHKIYPALSDLCKCIQRIYPYISDEQACNFAHYLGIEVPSGGWTWRYDVRHKDAAAISFHSGRHIELLSHIKAPTYLLFGQESWYNNLSDIQNRIQVLSNCVEIQNFDCGHNPHVECPQQLSEWLVQRTLLT